MYLIIYRYLSVTDNIYNFLSVKLNKNIGLLLVSKNYIREAFNNGAEKTFIADSNTCNNFG